MKCKVVIARFAVQNYMTVHKSFVANLTMKNTHSERTGNNCEVLLLQWYISQSLIRTFSNQYGLSCYHQHISTKIINYQNMHKVFASLRPISDCNQCPNSPNGLRWVVCWHRPCHLLIQGAPNLPNLRYSC